MKIRGARRPHFVRLAVVQEALLGKVVAQRYRLELLPNQSIVPDPQVTLRPKPGVLVRAAQRESESSRSALPA